MRGPVTLITASNWHCYNSLALLFTMRIESGLETSPTGTVLNKHVIRIFEQHESGVRAAYHIDVSTQRETLGHRMTSHIDCLSHAVFSFSSILCDIDT